jgi:hypothetical protein
MKNQSISILTILLLLVGCSDDSPEPLTTDLIGKWRLVEVLSDPGDGSGVFQKVDSEKNIVFGYDGMVSSNGNLCSQSTEINASTSGVYSLADSTISNSDCTLYFRLENGELTMGNFNCIEACSAKFLKIK